MKIHQVINEAGDVVAEFEDAAAADRYVNGESLGEVEGVTAYVGGASGGPFTIRSASESQIPGATADDA